MKPITLFYLKNCPFCKKAEAAIGELQKQDRYKDIEINRIEESVHPEIAEKYDYYYVPTFYINEKKMHEGRIFLIEIGRASCRERV